MKLKHLLLMLITTGLSWGIMSCDTDSGSKSDDAKTKVSELSGHAEQEVQLTYQFSALHRDASSSDCETCRTEVSVLEGKKLRGEIWIENLDDGEDDIDDGEADYNYPIHLSFIDDFTGTTNLSLALPADGDGTNYRFLIIVEDEVGEEDFRQYMADVNHLLMPDLQEHVSLVLHPVVGDLRVDIEVTDRIANFSVSYPRDVFLDFTGIPTLKIEIDEGEPIEFELSGHFWLTGDSGDRTIWYVHEAELPAVHEIHIELFDGDQILAQSLPEEETFLIGYGDDIDIDLFALHAEIAFGIDELPGAANFTFIFPESLVIEAGGVNELEVEIQIDGSVASNDRTLHFDSDDILNLGNGFYQIIYRVLEGNGLDIGIARVETAISATDDFLIDPGFLPDVLSIEVNFIDVGPNAPGLPVGVCLIEEFVLGTENDPASCELILSRRAIISGDVSENVLGINVLDEDKQPIPGAKVYANGQFMGLTDADSAFGAPGYIKMLLPEPGDYHIFADVRGLDLRGHIDVTLEPLGVVNHTVEVTPAWISTVDTADWPARQNAEVLVYNDRIWLMGGEIVFEVPGFPQFNFNTPNNEIWYSEAGEGQVLGADWTPVSANDPFWSARQEFGLVVFQGEMCVLGGLGAGTTPQNDMWCSTDGETWTEVLPAPASPRWSPRASFEVGVITDPNTQQEMLLLVGGRDADGLLKDVWATFDGSNWQRLDDGFDALGDPDPSETSTPWIERNQFSSVVYNNQLWIFGGQGSSGQSLSDVWWTADGKTWREVPQNITNGHWGGRSRQTVVFFNEEFWMFGGLHNGVLTNEVWASEDGAEWTLATENAPWEGRGLHNSFIFNNTMWVLAGSNDASDLLNDVWFY